MKSEEFLFHQELLLNFQSISEQLDIQRVGVDGVKRYEFDTIIDQKTIRRGRRSTPVIEYWVQISTKPLQTVSWSVSCKQFKKSRQIRSTESRFFRTRCVGPDLSKHLVFLKLALWTMIPSDRNCVMKLTDWRMATTLATHHLIVRKARMVVDHYIQWVKIYVHHCTSSDKHGNLVDELVISIESAIYSETPASGAGQKAIVDVARHAWDKELVPLSSNPVSCNFGSSVTLVATRLLESLDRASID
ncbi:uncharacterized protein TRUGW13939_10796 [Talaromyces rugulosus]|uniref:Uncharacterized protein n=1 Tax=Talaromyces rugulosus TaxID=121627 RepID=A0A7H8RDM9_TALRU|nr:uncharacterized protein TRUGW13939_10796 [Talaromyces rugulosus]QKX63625.1 hypothetical protein TRUGW13939_10796 [Talaromyces rugulosus]